MSPQREGGDARKFSVSQDNISRELSFAYKRVRIPIIIIIILLYIIIRARVCMCLCSVSFKNVLYTLRPSDHVHTRDTAAHTVPCDVQYALAAFATSDKLSCSRNWIFININIIIIVPLCTIGYCRSWLQAYTSTVVQYII